MADPSRELEPAMPLVGRDAELERLVRAAASLTDPSAEPTRVAILGAAGTGKSRLVREVTRAARAESAEVLTGRAVPGAIPAPYRPLREALLSWGRQSRREHQGEPAVLQHVLNAQATNEPLSPVFVGEAILRALVEHHPGPGTALVLEDLHWADTETLAVVEYLCDNAQAPGLLVVLTCRDEEPSAARDLLKRLAVRRSLELMRLQPLDPTQTLDLARALIGSQPQQRVLELVQERSEGVPLLVEELVAAVRARGGLEEFTGSAAAFVPDSVAEAVSARLDQLSESHRQVVQAASILGRAIDWSGLVAVTQQPEGEVLTALRAATERTLVEEDPERPGSLRFRHALIRDAVERSVFPPERALIAGRALDAMLGGCDIEHLSEDQLSAAYDLAVRSGRRDTALRLAMRNAAVSIDSWALSTGERWLVEARRYADDDQILAIDLENLRVASIAGRLDVVERIGRSLLARPGEASDETVLEARLRLTGVAIDEAHLDEADAHLDEVARLLQRVDDPCAVTRYELYRSAAALGRGDAEGAATHAERGIEHALPEPDQQDLACLGYLLLGRSRLPDSAAARDRWEQGLQLAKDAGMRLWAGRMLAELATFTVPELEGDAELALAEKSAYESGAVEVAERVGLLRAELAMLQGRFADAEHHLARAAEVAEGIVVALRTRQRAEELSALFAAMRGDESALERVASTGVRGAAYDAVSALLADGPTDLSGRIPRTLARAQTSDAEEFAAVVDDLADAPWFAAMLTRLRAGSYVDAGAGSAVRAPLRSALATFEELGLLQPAEACRALLRKAGVPVPKRGADQAGVPERLRAMGVTAREMDVLRLVAEGQTSREVGERLYLSPRTVEKHVERLMVKTGSVNRAALAALAASSDEAPIT